MTNKRKNTRTELPPWPVILPGLVFSLLAAWLVFSRQWEAWQALLVVSLAAMGISLLLLVILLLWSGPEERGHVWQVVRKTFIEDIDLLLRFFKLRR